MKMGVKFDAAKLASSSNQALRSRDLDLRPFEMDDIDVAYQRWMNDEEVVRFTRIPTYDTSLEGLRAYARRVIETPGSYFWSVVHRKDQCAIGTAKLVITLEHGIANWGYLIGERDYWRDSISLQAQLPVFDFAFDKLGVRKLYGGTDSDHIKSRFNFARMEFRKEGVFRQHFRGGADGQKIIDLVFYGMLASEWREISGKFGHLRYSHDQDD